MSARTIVVEILRGDGDAPTYEALLRATEVSRHNLSNALGALRREGLIVEVPATFKLSDEGRVRLAAEAVRRAAASKRVAERASAKKRAKRRAQAVVHPKPAPVVICASVLIANVPNSVFDLGRIAEVTA